MGDAWNNKIKTDESETDAESVLRMAQSGSTVLMTGSLSACSASAQMLQAAGIATRFVPIPNENGGLTATVDDFGAIRANSPNQKNAWAFLEILLGTEVRIHPNPEKNNSYDQIPFDAMPLFQEGFATSRNQFLSQVEVLPSDLQGLAMEPLPPLFLQQTDDIAQNITAAHLSSQADYALFQQLERWCNDVTEQPPPPSCLRPCARSGKRIWMSNPLVPPLMQADTDFEVESLSAPVLNAGKQPCGAGNCIDRYRDESRAENGWNCLQ